MAKAATAPANDARLRWARSRAGLSLDDAAKRVSVSPERLRTWESGEAHPTVNQLRNLARTYRQTIASLLRPGPVPEVGSDDTPADFRGASEEGSALPALRREIDKAEDRRRALLQLQPVPAETLPDIPDVLDDPERSAADFRRWVFVSTASRFRDSREALAAWIHQIESLGVLVFQMSRVDPDECRGISIWYPIYPIVILNGADEPEGRIFSLLHEVAHLLARQSGMCTLFTGAKIETRCNEFAGAALLPADEVRAELREGDPIGSIARIAATFRVSQSAVAIRLKSLDVIDQATLNRQLAIAVSRSRERRYQAREEARKSKGGPPHHILQLRNLGSRYVSAVIDALDAADITAVDASYYLESKLPTVERMRGELIRRGDAGASSVNEDDFATVSD